MCVLPSEVLLLLPLGSQLSGLSHVGPVRQRLQQSADVLILGPGSTDGELLLTLDYSPEGGTHTHRVTHTHTHTHTQHTTHNTHTDKIIYC